jgi:hypothetical protein
MIPLRTHQLCFHMRVPDLRQARMLEHRGAWILIDPGEADNPDLPAWSGTRIVFGDGGYKEIVANEERRVTANLRVSPALSSTECGIMLVG